MTRSRLIGASVLIVGDEPRRACAFSRAALVCKIDGQARPARVPFLNYAAALITSAWLAAGIVPGLAAPLPDEIGVLTCTVGAIVSATSAAAAGDGAREMFCAFKTGMGPEETYAGLLRSIGDDPLEGRAILWSVRAPLGTRYIPGLLQQTYAADRATPAGQVPALVGERNEMLSLHTLTEKAPGTASKGEQPAPLLIFADMELVLKAAVG